MQNNSLLPFSSGLTPAPIQAKVASLATRRAACTHLTMDRLYGNFRCNVCHRASELGWVYTCIQDGEADTIDAFESMTGKKTNSSDFSLDGVHDGFPREKNKSPKLTARLSPWIEKAIAQGHYTEDQMAILRAQKKQVFDTARAAIETFENSQDETYSSPQPTTASQCVDANPHLTFPVLHAIHETSPTGIPIIGSIKVPRLEMFPHCKFRACQLCRPTYRDRTWQCFDEIFENPMPSRAQAMGDENRPLASLSVMRNIGLRESPCPPPRPPLRSFDSRALYEFDDEGKIVFNNRSSHRAASAHSADIADASVEPESRGFRESMKRAFKGMLAARQNTTRSGGRRRRERESTTSDEDAAEFDMGLWQEMNDELLNDASSVPLPAKDSIEGLADGERVTDQLEETDIGGVGVTEEAADLNAADIIMSV